MLERAMLPRADTVCVSSPKPLSPVWLTGVWLTGVWLTGVWLTGAAVAASWLIGVWLTGVWFTGAVCWLDCESSSASGGTLESLTRGAPAAGVAGDGVSVTLVA